ncbi:MAG: diguanylate cyclase [Candidatus Izemoplasmatales bacterium]
MKQIGEFAKENNVTIKALHHYEKIGLIYPSFVDEETGYRYYSENESKELKSILFLKDLGLSLSEIKDIKEKDTDKSKLIQFFSLKLRQATNEINLTSKRVFKLNKIISNITNSNIEQNNLEEVLIMLEKELDTGKYGQGKFIEETEKLFEKALSNHTPLSVIELDLDYFKAINDNYGHDAGDIVLQRTWDSIVSTLQTSKYISTFERRGGDEFTVVVEATPYQASKLATDILNNVIDCDFSDIHENLKMSMTAGIAGISKKRNTYQQLLQDATLAMYQNKRNRK